MSVSRREFLRAGAIAATAAAIPRPLRASFGGRPTELPAIDDPRVRALALAAVGAAKQAGAAYADARLAHGWTRGFGSGRFRNAETMDVGVRALVQGYWGFASSPVWSPDEMARLGREAVHQAKANALGKPRVVTLAPCPVVADASWVTPVKIDPFETSPLEIVDYLDGLRIFASRIPGVSVEREGATFTKQEKAFASTDGTFCTQRLYRSEGVFEIKLEKNRRVYKRTVDLLAAAGVGYELYRGQPLRDEIRRLVEEMERDATLPIKPVDVGRYETVIDADGMAELLDTTLGRATELDRALGYEANAGGTSWVNAPLDMLGTLRVGAPLLTVTANRSEPGGAATVRWDDEGVAPDDFTLVDRGVLADFQTVRESAGWLADYYAKHGRPARSHGCANVDSAVSAPMQHVPNLAIAPGRGSEDYEALLAGMSKGIALEDLDVEIDFQALNGLADGRFYEITKGKRTAIIANAGVLFRAPELWKSLHALGGARSARRFAAVDAKGEPRQNTVHSVTTVPGVFHDVTLIDPQRKA